MRTANESMPRERIDIAVLRTIAEVRPVHVMELAASLEEHPVTVEQTCVRLTNNGYIRRATYGQYTLTENGQSRLEQQTK